MTAQELLSTLTPEELLALRDNTQSAAVNAAIDDALGAEDDG